MGSQAARVRRSVEADPEEEGEDHEEAGPQDGVHRLQVEEPGSDQENQTLRAGGREEAQGPDDPVLDVQNDPILDYSTCSRRSSSTLFDMFQIIWFQMIPHVQ